MHITPECVGCIFNQALRVTQELRLSAEQSKEVLDLASTFIPKFRMDANPPQNATMMYEAIARHLGMEDIYTHTKTQSTLQALKHLPFCERLLASSPNPFVDSTKIAIAGNVIDLASQVRFDISKELETILQTPLAIDDTQKLYRSLQNTTNFVYLADNAGEHIFDMIYIKYLKKHFENLTIYYFVRGNPIINDVTYAEAKAAGIDQYATIINSGAATPCIIAENLTGKPKELFDTAQTIISKGMGNYECLNHQTTYPIFFLLKVKCSVVSQSLGEPVGAIVCKSNRGE